MIYLQGRIAKIQPFQTTLIFAIAILISYQLKNLLSLTRTKEDFDQDTVIAESQRQDKTIRVTCDSDPCEGFFAYDMPNNDDENASEAFQKAVATYRYGPEGNNETHNTMIFMPTSTDHSSCVKEWKESRAKWVNRGMSANTEDLTIYDAFFSSPTYRGKNHTYMEIGAHDGVRESNSRFYDLCLGWSGLLVEPHPANYNKTLLFRPNAHRLGVAPSCRKNESGTVLFSDHMYTSAEVGGGKLEIHCGPLQHYLDELGIRHIDFWSLDVEGSELKVLETVDFDRTHVDVIIVESANRMSHLPSFQKKVKDVRTLLQSKGYLMMKSVSVPKSDIFLHRRACVEHSHISECQQVAANV